jgi:hypothetical protein
MTKADRKVVPEINKKEKKKEKMGTGLKISETFIRFFQLSIYFQMECLTIR